MQLQLIYNLIMVTSVAALWLSVQMPSAVEDLLAYFLILTIGLGHGANDVKLYFKEQLTGKKQTVLFITIYAALVLIGFSLFFIIPDVVLAAFIVVSGYHFGQEHFSKYGLHKTIGHRVFCTAYGLTIITAILYLHTASSLKIINDLVHVNIDATLLYRMLVASAITTVLTGVLVMRAFPLKDLALELFYVLLLYILFATGSLIYGFAVYFILWHSVPSIYNQITNLHGTVTKTTVVHYVKSSLLYWIAALIFLAGLYYILHDRTTLFLTVIVAFLGGITFPHVVVMDKLYKSK